jgi:DNA-binding transcriptional MerR regulator
MSEQAQRVENKNIPQWAQGLYYSSGITSEVLVYYDEEAIYFEHRGKDSGIVRYTFEQIEGLKIVEDEEEESTDSHQ